MPNSRYVAGRAFEYATIEDLKVNGYETMRAAGSHGKVDIFAFKPGQLLFIQCKKDGKISPAERTEVLRLATIAGAVPLIGHKIAGKSKVLYDQITGTGPKDRAPFELDEVGP